MFNLNSGEINILVCQAHFGGIKVCFLSGYS